MSTIYSTIEDEISARLAAEAWEKVDVLPVPEREKDLKLPVPNIQLIVQYAGSKFGGTKTTNPVSQEETGHFNVILQSKKLRGTTGIYDLLIKIKKSLLGFKPTGCQKLQIVPDKGIEFVEFSDDLWQFSITLSTTWVTVEFVPDVEDEVLITQLNLKEV